MAGVVIRQRIEQALAAPDGAVIPLIETLLEERLITVGAAMACLEPGESVKTPSVFHSTFQAAKRMARKRIGSDTAKWSSQVCDDGVIIRREADAWCPRSTEARAGSAAQFLASMKIGDSRIAPRAEFRNVHHALTNTRKASARKLLGDPDANWVSRMTNHGVRVTRVR